MGFAILSFLIVELVAVSHCGNVYVSQKFFSLSLLLFVVLVSWPGVSLPTVF